MKIKFENYSTNTFPDHYEEQLLLFFRELWNKEVGIDTKEIFLIVWPRVMGGSDNLITYDSTKDLFTLAELKIGYYSHNTITLENLNWRYKKISNEDSLITTSEMTIEFELKSFFDWIPFLKSFFANKSKKYTRLETKKYSILISPSVELDMTIEIKCPQKEWGAIAEYLYDEVNKKNELALTSGEGLIHTIYEGESRQNFLILHVDLGSSGIQGLNFLIENLKNLKFNIEGIVIH
jgi:hypothetical protein